MTKKKLRSYSLLLLLTSVKENNALWIMDYLIHINFRAEKFHACTCSAQKLEINLTYSGVGHSYPATQSVQLTAFMVPFVV